MIIIIIIRHIKHIKPNTIYLNQSVPDVLQS